MEEKSVLPVSTDQKKIIRGYIGELKMLEIERLKLRRLNEKLAEKKGEIIEAAEVERKAAAKNVREKKDYYKDTIQEKGRKIDYDIGFGMFLVLLGIIVGCVLGLVVNLVFNWLIVSFIKSFFEIIIEDNVLSVIKWVFIILGGGTGLVLMGKLHVEDIKDKKNKHLTRVSYLKQDEKNLHEAECHLRECDRGVEMAKKKSHTLEKQIKLNEEKIEQIGTQIKKMHQFNIIPWDYRTIDCIITLDHIFKNDLADTVRDAILLYEDWAFKGKIITGFDNIYKMMGNLSESMQYMQRTLDSIDQSVSSMSNDMTRLIGLQKANNRTQEQILQESQATRSATESIQRSNEKYEWYVEQHRQGLL